MTPPGDGETAKGTVRLSPHEPLRLGKWEIVPAKIVSTKGRRFSKRANLSPAAVVLVFEEPISAPGVIAWKL